MKTNIGIETTDEERNRLYRVWNDDPESTKMVSRKDITARVLTHIEEELAQSEETKATPCEQEPETKGETFVPSRGDEPYLAQPKDPGIAAACGRILDDTAIIERFAWDTIERNRK